MERRAGECDVRNVARQLVNLARRYQVRAAAGDRLPRLVEVEQRRTERIDITVARAQHAVVEQQPPFRGLDGNGARADLHALPRRNLESRGRHHMTVAAPELHVGTLRIEDVAESRMPVVARTRQHGETAVDLAGEQHAVAVEGDEGVLQLVERLEVVGPRDADRRAVVAVAPRDVIFVVDLRNTRVVAVNPLGDFGIGAHEFEILLADIPLDAVHRESGVDAHAAVRIVAAENARIVILAFLEGNDRRVENAVRRRKRVARDDRIGRIAPHHFFGACGTILPRHIRHGRAYDFQVIHNYLSFGLSS